MNDPLPVQSVPLLPLKAVRLQPGDVVVMTFPDGLTPRMREHWLGVLEAVFPEHESLLLDGGADLSILRTEPAPVAKTRPFPRRKVA